MNTIDANTNNRLNSTDGVRNAPKTRRELSSNSANDNNKAAHRDTFEMRRQNERSYAVRNDDYGQRRK
ncbi:MAG: hypothetical protein FWF51_10070 [Chitinivibrionia bacterium]|nr:hypothetical protein [Chitinivibrionia bacterium]